MTGQFDHILHWKLLKGGHDFPGPDGGTCINEAAVVAAGLPYRKIYWADDCPPCFSRPLAQYALCINDRMDDEVRQCLMPFVTRLAGTADCPMIEKERTRFLLRQVYKRLFTRALRIVGYSNLVDECVASEEEREVFLALRNCNKALDDIQRKSYQSGADIGPNVLLLYRASRDLVIASKMKSHEDAVKCIGLALGHIAAIEYHRSLKVWAIAVEILDAALRIGRQPPEIEAPLVLQRFEDARGNVRLEPAS